MPTENRSSNTEMVSELLPCPFCGQQDLLIERLDSDASIVICQGLTGPHEACLARGPVGVAQDDGEEQPGRDKAVELWNARVAQHQGEPVALPARREPNACNPYLSDGDVEWNACLDEIAKLGPLYTHPAPADQQEPVAWRTNFPGRWVYADSPHTFDEPGLHLSEGSKLEHWEALYSHASDPGEVERLRIDLSNTQALLDQANHHKTQRGETIEALRAQLAERDALLNEASEWIKQNSFHGTDAVELWERIDLTIGSQS